MQIRGLKKDQDVIDKVTADLEKFIAEELVKFTEPQREKITTKCFENLKNNFKVGDKLKALQNQYPKIIKSFDVSKKDGISVEYNKIELPDDIIPSAYNPDWNFVRNEVEGIIPYSVALHLNKDDLEDGRNVEDEVIK